MENERGVHVAWFDGRAQAAAPDAVAGSTTPVRPQRGRLQSAQDAALPCSRDFWKKLAWLRRFSDREPGRAK